MDQPNTTAWCKAVCTATGNFFTYWTPCCCGWKTPCFSCNTDHLNIAISYIFPDTGLARLPQCQSGVWTSGRKISLFEMVAGNDACGKYVYSKAFCPTGKLLISGGYLLSKWSGGSGWNSPDLSMPSAPENAWQIYSGGGVTGGTCMRAIAWCAKN
ncbi:hypothetical protein JX043_001539 [Salmonella enterica]|nr:hypothetical protein [Salmonella enterica]EGS7868161.1 hypothetical protein [Salmonella enterica]EHB4177556.1 hypothetical protein [Salmonella enterica]EIA6595740.1 hypothetical protein [Salmonella enterica]EIK6606311.1 hypothetical protein [Salmonella enterica]